MEHGLLKTVAIKGIYEVDSFELNKLTRIAEQQDCRQMLQAWLNEQITLQNYEELGSLWQNSRDSMVKVGEWYRQEFTRSRRDFVVDIEILATVVLEILNFDSVETFPCV
jgi:hypothetical protein